MQVVAPVVTKAISIHALLAESDGLRRRVENVHKTFLSTLSLRRATPPQAFPFAACVISIHALLAESDPVAYNGGLVLCISIHALLAESDTAAVRHTRQRRDFYPRSPCGERRGPLVVSVPVADFYPRSPCGERLRFQDRIIGTRRISIHALLAESDRVLRKAAKENTSFLSTLSLRRATLASGINPDQSGISIHALLAESDISPTV